jgi:hypothetical protein
VSVVRELVATFGIDFDKKGAREADSWMDHAKKAASTLGITIGVGAAIAGLKSLTKAASDVAETKNVIEASFGDAAGSVLDWANTTSGAIGRSQFLLRDYAATLGAILSPTLQNDKAAAEMSTTLGALTVDLASFFNSTENDALVALRAGLIGESEPLRRFGVLLSEARVQEKAMAMGLAKDKKHIDNAAKAQARYAIILEDTANAQGDAVKTGGSYANLLRRMDGVMFDLKVGVGSFLIGPAEGFLKWAVASGTSLGELVRNSDLVKATFIALAAVLAPFAVNMLIASAPVLLAAIGFGVLTAAIEDVIGAMTGKQSVIGTFFKELNDGIDMFMDRHPALKAAVADLRGLVDAAAGQTSGGAPPEGEAHNARRIRNAMRGGNVTGTIGAPTLPSSFKLPEPRSSLTATAPRAPISLTVHEGPVTFDVKGSVDKDSANSITRQLREHTRGRNYKLLNTTGTP